MSSKKGGNGMDNNASTLLAYGMIGPSLLTGLLVLLRVTLRGHWARWTGFRKPDGWSPDEEASHCVSRCVSRFSISRDITASGVPRPCRHVAPGRFLDGAELQEGVPECGFEVVHLFAQLSFAVTRMDGAVV